MKAAVKRLRTIISNLSLVLRCYLLLFVRGKANKEIVNPKSAVIIQRGKFGDMIATTPMFRAIKKAYPNCKITVVSGGLNKKVLDGNPDIDRYIMWDDNVDKVIEELRKDTYDFGCLTSPNFHSFAALYLGGVKLIAAPIIRGGMSPYETRPYKMVRRLGVLKDHYMRRYVPREFLKLLEPIGIHSENTKKYIYWTPEGETKAKETISHIKGQYRFLVGILPGAGNKVKQWQPERFAEVADYLVRKYDAHIIIIGSEENKKEIEAMIPAVKHKERLTNTEGTSVDEVKALVSKLDFTVSVDTGPVFIAEASGVPTIDIAGSIDPNEMAPNDGDKHLVVVSEGEPLIMTMNARDFDREEARRQIEGITVKMVTDVVDELVGKLER